MTLRMNEDATRKSDCEKRWEGITSDITHVNIYLEIFTKTSTIRNRVNEK